MTLYNFIMGVHILGMIIMFLEIVYVTTQKPSAMQTHIIMLLVVTLLMFIGYYIELTAPNIEVAYLGTVIAYIGKPFILNCGLQIVCDFYNIPMKRWLYYTTAGISAFVSVSVITAPINHLYYKSWTFDPTSIYCPLQLDIGPLYYVYFASIVFFFGLSLYLIIRETKKNNTKENRTYAYYFALMLGLGQVGYIVYLTDLSKGYDASVFGIMGSVSVLSILFFRYRIFDVLTLAKDKALEHSPTGTIIVNENNNIEYANQTGYKLVSGGLKIDDLQNETKDITRYKDGLITYEVVRRKIDVRGLISNTSYEFTDITNSVNYQARLEKEVKERTAKIESMQRKIVSSFASIVEARSLETGEHILRTSEYVELTIKALKAKGLYKDVLTDKYINCLIDVAPLHDIGKISIPDKILLKPGRLTPKEFKLMQNHAEIGAKIIESTMKGVEDDDYVKMAMDVANYHHERWDGEGYPNKLKGEEIPLCARIMALADCFDALVSKRCYKQAFTKKKAISILKEESGTHFDPEIVEAFLSAIK